MPAGDANYELNIDIDWSRGKASTDQFLSEIQGKINALQSRAALPQGDPDHLSSVEFGQQARVQVEVAKQLVNELVKLGRMSQQVGTSMVRDINKTNLAQVAAQGKTAEQAYVAYGKGGANSQASKAARPIVATIAGQFSTDQEAAEEQASGIVAALKERLRVLRALAALDAQQLDKSQTTIALQAEIIAAERLRGAAIKAQTARLLGPEIKTLAKDEARSAIFERDLASRVNRRVASGLDADPRYAERLGETALHERSIELQKNLAFERQLAANMAENVRLVAEETQLRRLRLAEEKAAASKLSPAAANRLADLESQSAINERLQRSRVKERTSDFFAGDSAEAIANREREALAAVDDRIAKIKLSVEQERLYATYLAQNIDQVREEFALRQANNAALRRAEQEFLASNDPAAKKIRDDRAAADLAKSQGKRLQDEALLAAGGPDEVRERGRDAARGEVATLQRRLVVAREALGSAVTDAELMQGRVKLSADVTVAERQLKEAIDKQTTATLGAAGYITPPPKGQPPRVGAGANGEPSLFQRGYGKLTGRDPLDVESGRRFVASRFASTAAYGVSGALLYGGLQAIKDTISEAEELESQFNILESQYIALDRAGELPEAKKAIFEIARQTGVATDQIAKLAVQFTGAFRDAGASEEAQKIAAELSVIGDLAPEEIFNDLIAGARAFAADSPGQTVKEQADAQVAALERLGDLSIQARNLSGVQPKELLDFLGRVGPSAKAASVDLEELNAIGAAVLQGSGLSGAALGDQFNRILTDFSKNAGDLFELVHSTPELASKLGEGFDEKLFAGDASAILDLVRAFEGLSDPALKRNIISELGSRREGQTLAALFENASTAIEIYGKRNDAAGTRAAEFARKQDTLKQNIKEFSVELEQLGLTIFESGLGDFLTFMVQNFTLLATAVKELVELFGQFNDATGGMALKLAAVVAGLKLLGLASKGLGALGLPATLGAVSARAGGSVRPGGFFSPYSLATGYGPGGGLSRGLQGGGVITRAAQRGGLVGGAAAGLASAAPIIATTALVSLAATFASERDAADQNAGNLKGIVADRVKRGDAFQSIRDDIKNLNTKYSNVEKLAFFTHGQKTPAETALDSVQDEEFDAFVQQQVSFILDERGAEFERIVNSSEFDPEANQGDRLQQGPPQNKYKEARKVLEDYLKNPTDDSLREQVDLLIEGAKNSHDVGLIIDINAAIDSFNTRQATLGDAADAAAELNDPKRAVELDDLLRGYEAGEIPASQVEAKLREDIALLDEFIAGARESDNIEGVLFGLDEKKKREESLKSVALDPIKERATVANFVNSIRGAGPEVAVDTALQSYRDIVATGVADPSDQLDALETLITAQRAAFMEWVDAAPDAVTRLARLREGFDVTPEIQRAIIEVQLATGTNKDAIAKIADAMNQSVEAVSGALTNAMIDSVEGAIEIQRQMLLARRRDLENAQAIFGGFLGGQADVSAAIAAVDAALAALSSIQVVAPPASGQAPPAEIASAEKAAADEQKAAADKARQEAIAKQNALFDIETARSQGNAVELARIAQRRARYAQQVATTESERLAAVAQYIEATTALDEALREQTSAQRDLAVAKSHDDPVKAATAALNDAKDAVTAARGVGEKARAMADQIRADRALNDAIQEAFQARIGILIASAEASGDSVEVARQQLRIINNQLARRDLNKTERDQLEAERIGAEAGVRDAMLSEQRATIDYQLAIGDITKQQAISALQSLLTIPKLTEEQVRDINLAIKNLRDQLGQDFQFNLPTQLGLPTVYEVRRLGDSGGTGSSYQDNRQINVQVYAETNASAAEIGAAVAAAVGDPTRSGTIPKRY